MDEDDEDDEDDNDVGKILISPFLEGRIACVCLMMTMVTMKHLNDATVQMMMVIIMSDIMVMMTMTKMMTMVTMMMKVMMMVLVKPDITVTGWKDGMSLITRISVAMWSVFIENQKPNHVAMWWTCIERGGSKRWIKNQFPI